MPHSIPRLLQQQPRAWFAREQQQQQQSGSTEFQPPRGQREPQMGEGSYEVTREKEGKSHTKARGE